MTTEKTVKIGRFTYIVGLLIPWAVGVVVILWVFTKGLLSL